MGRPYRTHYSVSGHRACCGLDEPKHWLRVHINRLESITCISCVKAIKQFRKEYNQRGWLEIWKHPL